jgi:hypothetical protein
MVRRVKNSHKKEVSRMISVFGFNHKLIGSNIEKGKFVVRWVKNSRR